MMDFNWNPFSWIAALFTSPNTPERTMETANPGEGDSRSRSRSAFTADRDRDMIEIPSIDEITIDPESRWK